MAKHEAAAAKEAARIEALRDKMKAKETVQPASGAGLGKPKPPAGGAAGGL